MNLNLIINGTNKRVIINLIRRLSPDAASAIKKMLIKNPSARLCSQRGVSELFALPFFKTINTEALINKQVQMPYVPSLESAFDISSFEDTFTKEKPVDSGATADPVTVSDNNGKAKRKGILTVRTLKYLQFNKVVACAVGTRNI